MPCTFQEKYPTKYSIIDGSEIFIETCLCSRAHGLAQAPQYWLIGCTPNDAISYVSQLYVGSISNVELTRVSGFLQTLDGKSGVSMMAD